MRHISILWITATAGALLLSACTQETKGTTATKAGDLDVQIAIDPDPPTTGDNRLVATVRDAMGFANPTFRLRASSTRRGEASTRCDSYPCSESHAEYVPAAPPTSITRVGGFGSTRSRISFVRSNSSREVPAKRRSSSG